MNDFLLGILYQEPNLLCLWLSTPWVFSPGVESGVFPATETGGRPRSREAGNFGEPDGKGQQVSHPGLMPYGLRATRNRAQGYKRMLAATDDLTFQRGSRELLTTTSKWSLTGNRLCIQVSERPSSKSRTPSHRVLQREAPLGSFPRLACFAQQRCLPWRIEVFLLKASYSHQSRHLGKFTFKQTRRFLSNQVDGKDGVAGSVWFLV